MRDSTQWWLQLEASLQRNRVHAFARYFQVATVRPNGRPANRTVVYRGAVQRGDDCAPYLTFVSDMRSGKHDDFKKCSWCEICWYLPVTREQYRITGYAEVVDASNDEVLRRTTRQQIWARLTPPLQAPFFAPTPGMPLQAASASDTTISVDEAGVPETFGLVLVLPTRVDHLQLANSNGCPPHRTCYYRHALQPEEVATDPSSEPEIWQAESVQP